MIISALVIPMIAIRIACDVTWTRIVDLALPVIGVKNAIRAELKGALVGLQPCYGA
jgi:hypothetical protein